MINTGECLGEVRNAYRVFVRELHTTKLFGSAECEWDDAINIDVRERGFKGMN
jgi:hypothetical protein